MIIFPHFLFLHSAPIPHNRTCIRFNESSYTGRVYIGSSARGTKILTVGVVACDSTIIKNYTAHFALNGYLSDYFDIGKPSGVITTSGLRLTVRLYSFYVSAFIDITYKNGTRIQNFTETNVRIDVNGEYAEDQASPSFFTCLCTFNLSHFLNPSHSLYLPFSFLPPSLTTSLPIPLFLLLPLPSFLTSLSLPHSLPHYLALSLPHFLTLSFSFPPSLSLTLIFTLCNIHVKT